MLYIMCILMVYMYIQPFPRATEVHTKYIHVS